MTILSFWDSIFSEAGMSVLSTFGIAIALFCSWMILIFSKIIFNKFFTHYAWLCAFILIIAFNTFFVLLYASQGALYLFIGHGVPNIEGYVMTVAIWALILSPIMAIFFVCYLLNFIFRLVCHLEQKKINTKKV